MKLDFKKILLTGSALVAVGAFSGQAQAATEITNGGTSTVSDPAGLVETTAGNTAFTINSAGGTLTFGSAGNATPALVMNSTGNTLTATVTSSGAQGTIIFADNVTETAGDIVINDTTDNLTFQGNVSSSPITMGSGSANPTLTLRVESVAAENITFAGVVNAHDDDDTVNLVVLNTEGTSGNTVTFTGALGGSTVATALDAITIGADNTSQVNAVFGGNVNSTGAFSIGTGNVGNNTANVTFGTSGSTSTVTTGTIAGGGAADTNNIIIAGGSTVVVNSALGANLDSIQIGSNGTNTTATFTAGIATGPTFTIGAGAGTVDTNSVTFDATTASFTVNPAVVGGATADTNNIVVAGGAARTVTFANAIGAGNAIDNVTVNANTGLTTQSTLTATTALTLGAGATLTASGAVTAPAITLGAGSVVNAGTAGTTFTGDINGAGTLNFTSAGASVVGSVGAGTALTAVNVGTGADLTINATAGNRSLAATTIALAGAGSALTLTPGANTITVSNAITAGTNNQGIVNVTDGTGTVTFNSNVGTAAAHLASFNVSPAGATAQTVVANGNLYANAVTLGNNDTLDLFGSSGTVSGTIDGVGGAGRGSVIVGNGTAASNYTFGSATGSTNTLSVFRVTANSTANVSQNVATTAAGAGVAGLENLGTLNIDSTNNTVALSAATGRAFLNGTETITGANNVTVTAGNAMFINGALSTTLSGASRTLTLTSPGGIAVGAVADTTINAGNQIVLGGPTTIGAGGRVNTLNIVKTADFNPATTTVLSGGANAVTVSGTLNVGLGSNGVALANGDAITVISSTGGSNFGTLLGNGTIVLQNTGLVQLADNGSNGTGLRVVANFLTPASVLTSQANAATATALENFPGATGTLAIARGNLLSASTGAQANLIAESLAPPADNAVVVAASDFSDRIMGLTTTRLASLRTGNPDSGIAAGNSYRGMRGWGEVFGRTSDQDRRKGTAGYEADQGGLAVGMDGMTVDNVHLGVGIAYANTDIDSDNANRTNTDIDSYQISVYGEVPLANKMFINGMVGYVFNDNQTTRHNVGGIAGLNANGDFNAHQAVARAQFGRDFMTGYGMTLTPTALVNYTYYRADDYTETGAGTANLNVNSDALNALEFGVGLNAAWDIRNGDGSKFVPSLNAAYRYDVIGDSFDTTSSFTGGGAAFNTQGVDPSNGTGTLGAGLKYVATTNVELSAQYSFDIKEDYTAHAGQLRAAYKF